MTAPPEKIERPIFAPI